jgi:hypothetical protein
MHTAPGSEKPSKAGIISMHPASTFIAIRPILLHKAFVESSLSQALATAIEVKAS